MSRNDAGPDSMEDLGAFVGQWRVETTIPDAPVGHAAFEWMPGRRFLVHCWGFPSPADMGASEFGGTAIIGLDPSGRGYLQHYFDSCGVARCTG